MDRSRLFTQGAITVVALLLTYAAFDDITTDHATTTFRAEYGFLVGCAVWLLYVSSSLWRGHHRGFGFGSLVALSGALWAHRASGPVVVSRAPEYIAMIAAYLWFWALAGAMLWLAWRARTVIDSGATPPERPSAAGC